MGVPNTVSPIGKRIRHFVGAESSKQLAFVDDLHRLGLNHSVDLPELVVVGDQNTGKSSVLQAITEISFPVESALCTRFPIKISFRQSPGTSTVVQAEILPGPSTQNDKAFMERIKDFQFTSDELSADVMAQIVQEATNRIFSGEDQATRHTGQTLSDATLYIKRSGPNEMHWTIVDLPGLVQNRGHQSSSKNTKKFMVNGDEHSEHLDNSVIAKNLVRSFLKNERNIVLWVVDDTDIARHKTLELFGEIPGLDSRSIGILTKCDRKQETSDRWMVKLLRNELPGIPRLDQGWFGLRNRKPVEADISDEERDQNESNLFRQPEWDAVPAGRTGIKALMDYVDRKRRVHIQESLPTIIGEIRNNLRNCEAELEKLGEVRDNTAAQRHYAFQFCIELQNMADAALRARYQDIPSDDDKVQLRYKVNERLEKFELDMRQQRPGLSFNPIQDDLYSLSTWNDDLGRWLEGIADTESVYGEIYRESKVCQGTNLPGSISPEVEEKIFRKQSAHWKDIAFELVDDIKTLVKDCHDIFLKCAIPDSRTRGEVIAMTAKAREAWDADIDAELTELLDDNRKRRLVTLQPFLLAESHNFDRTLSQEIEHCRQKMRERNGKGEKVEVKISSKPDDSSKTRLSFETNQIFRVRKRLEVYYHIALYRFIDNVAMQVVERHVLGPNSPINAVSTKLLANLSDEDLGRIAGEDEAVTQLRERLTKDRTRYKKALARWEQVRSV